MRGKPFTREQTLTAAVWNGGDDPRTPTGDENEGGRPGNTGPDRPNPEGECCRSQLRLIYIALVLLLLIALILWFKL